MTPTRTLGYGELLAHARAVAAAVTDAGCRPGERVGIVMDKGWEQVAAALGVLLAGCAYLPVDTTQPALRRDAVLADAEARLVLTQSWLAPALGRPGGPPAVAVDTLDPAAPDANGREPAPARHPRTWRTSSTPRAPPARPRA